MKKIILLVISAFYISCNYQSKSTESKSNNTKEKILKESSKVPKKTDSLNDIEKTNSKDCLNEFNFFLKEFSVDSLTQIKKVKFPLKYSYYEDSINDEITTESLEKKDFIFIDFKKDKEALNKETDKFTVEIQEVENCNFLYKRKGYDNGIMETYKFKKEGDSWFLIQIFDESL
ncbi:hypothetical protein [Tenacibaculum sp. 190524A02b]|uniref:hypothetical protein n=1 Tax=Tenacibaculum vairaonense TaxID=3137860 RepID=UPI0031FB4DEC